MKLLSCKIKTKHTVRNLGVLIEEDLKMKSQVNAVAKTCYVNIRLLRKLRKHLTIASLKTLVQAFVLSRLDYVSAFYYGMAENLFDKLQRV